MKSIFAQFKKKNRASSETNSDNLKLQHSFGDGSSNFLPARKAPLLLSALLLVVLGVFGYQYLGQTGEVTIVAAPMTAATKTTSSPQLSIAAARELFENRRLDESIETYRKMLGKSPHDAQVLNDLGVLYLKKQAFKESESHLKRSISEAPNCVVCLNNLGYLKTLEGESAQAEKLFKQALSINASYIDPYFNLGVLYEKNGDFAGSVMAYNEFITRSKEPNSSFNLKLKQHINNLLEK